MVPPQGDEIMRVNPMPVSGAILLRNNGSKAAPLSRVLARLRNSAKRRHNIKIGPRKKNRSFKRGAHGRFAKRRNGLAIRTNGLAIRTNRRRNGLAVGFRGLAIRTNGIAIVDKAVGTVTGLVSKVTGMIPVVGKPLTGVVGMVGSAAKVVLPIIAGAAGVGLAMKLAAEYIHQIPYIGEKLAEVYGSKIGFTAAGATLGAAGALLPIPMLSKTQRLAIAGSFVAGGMVVDMLSALNDYMDGDTALPATAGLGEGLWQLGGRDASSRPFAFGDVSGAYADASPADAAKCADDLDAVEGQVALLGPDAWLRKFPRYHTSTRPSNGMSRHAGKHGHQWGWAIRFIGYDRFQKLAAMSPVKRRKIIAKLRAQAVSMIDNPAAHGLAGLIIAQ